MERILPDDFSDYLLSWIDAEIAYLENEEVSEEEEEDKRRVIAELRAMKKREVDWNELAV